MNKIKDISKTQIGRNEGEVVKLLCYHCGVDTNHKILISRDQEWYKIFEGIEVPVPWNTSRYQISQCKGCEHISLQHVILIPNIADEEGNLITKERLQLLYPPRIKGRQYIDDYQELPLNVLLIYQETYSALCYGFRILTGVGIRAIVETVCKERGAKGRNLEKRIENLVVQGVLTRDAADVLHELRFMGNDAAHEVEPHDNQTLAVAMDIAENLLQNVYIIPQKGERLKDRKKQTK